jgi:hypothetical protein
LAEFWNVFDGDLVKQHRNRVKITSKGIGTHAHGFDRNGAASAKRIYDERAATGGSAQGFVRCLRKCAACVEEFAIGGVVPVGKIGNEIEESTAELDRVIEKSRFLPRIFEADPALRAK